MEKQNDRKKRIWFLLILGVAIGLILLLGGRMEFHTELEREVRQNVFLGYVENIPAPDKGCVVITAERYPSWCQGVCEIETQTISWGKDSGQCVGVFADVVYYENRYELRNWFSGHLLKRTSEYYYKLDTPLQLRFLEEGRKPEIDIGEIRAVDYDYTAYKGK